MTTCADCHDPPGGRVCCEGGLTPVCFIEDGKAQSICLDISKSLSESPAQFAAAMVDSIARLAGEAYRADAAFNLSLVDGLLSYESFDGRIQVRARRVETERGGLSGFASA